MTDENNHRIVGTAATAKGKTTTIIVGNGKLPSGNLRTVKVVGTPDPTNSEIARDELISLVLTGKKKLLDSPFVQMLWFPDTAGQTASTVKGSKLENVVPQMELNNSQCTAMRAMVGKSPIVIVHGMCA
jgi:hypothetical protein